MRISDWSSDVCSSDLPPRPGQEQDMDALVSTEWLERELGASDLRIVDATKFMAGTGRDARAEYEAGHIPGAVFMDLAELADANNAVENMAPPPEKFASRMQSLGPGHGRRIRTEERPGG